MDLEGIKIKSSWKIFKRQSGISKENLVLNLRIDADLQMLKELDGRLALKSVTGKKART